MDFCARTLKPARCEQKQSIVYGGIVTDTAHRNVPDEHLHMHRHSARIKHLRGSVPSDLGKADMQHDKMLIAAEA